MAWVTRWVFNARFGEYVNTRVWVPDPPEKKPASRAAAEAEARRRAQEAARQKAAAAAKRQAARRAAEQLARAAADQRAEQLRVRQEADKRTAERRRLAYERLVGQQNALLRRAQLIRDARTPAPKPVSKPPPRPGPTTSGSLQAEAEFHRRRSEGAKRVYSRLVSQKAAKRAEVERQQWAELDYQWRKRFAVSGESRPQDMESIIREEERRAASGRIDAPFVAKLAERYAAYAEEVAAKRTTVIDKINDAIDAGNVELAQRLYQRDLGPLDAEFRRLFGDGSHPEREGALADFFNRYANIERAQAEWWKSQMRSILDADRSEVNRRLKDAISRGDVEEIRQLQELSRVYAGQTGWTTYIDEEGRRVRRRRTIEEELDYREAQRRIEMERLRSQYENQLRHRERHMRSEGLVEGPGGLWMTPEQRSASQHMIRLVDERYGGRAPRISRPEDLTRWIDEVLSDWEREHPRPRLGGVASVPGQYQKLQTWKRERAAYEDTLYSLYGGKSPEPWERLFQVPGVSHGLAILQAGVASIGAGGRIILKATTGSSKLDLGLNSSDIPPHVRSSIENRAIRMGTGEGKNLSFGTRFNPTQAIERARGQLYMEWLMTPEGRKWAEDRARRWSEEDRQFLEALYGAGTDPAAVAGRLFSGEGVDALNFFGQSPTTNTGADLMFQLLADPTNAIPLKFTTYLARGRFAAENAGKTKFLGSTKFGRVRDFLSVDEGTLRLRRELDKLLKDQGDKSARQLTDELLLEVANAKDKSEMARSIEKKLVSAGIDRRKVNDAQLFNLVENAVKQRLRREGVDYVSQSDELRQRISEAQAARKARDEARVHRQAQREQQLKLGRQRRLSAGLEARERLIAAKTKVEAQLQAEVAAQKSKTAAGVGAPPAGGAAREVSGRPPAPAKPKPSRSPLSGDGKVERSDAEKRIAPLVLEKPKRAVPEVRRARHAEEYYKPDAMGNWLPKDSKVLADPRYRRLAAAAKGGDPVARERLALLARERRNIFRMEAEDLKRNSPFTQTDFDLMERAGVAHDAQAGARLLTDRETVRHLKRTLAAAKKEGKDVRDYVREFQLVEGRTIERDWDIDRPTVNGRIEIGDDLIAATDESPRGLNDAYEVFSGLDNRTQYYRGGIYDKVRSVTWRKSLGEKRFGQFLQMLDDETMGSGVAGFRDGGQALFELFHRLRLAKDFKKLERLSSYVDAYLRELEAPTDSLFAWQWKVMEERAGLPWAWNWQTVEEGFMEAAAAWSMHPNLALAMIPNGFYAHRAPNRFRLSSALLGLEQSPAFRAAPGTWVEGDALRAITATFAKGVEGNSTRIVHYAAERFGSFAKAFKLRNRIMDELTHAVRNEMGVPELAAVLAARPEALPAELLAFVERSGKSVAEVIELELKKRPALFPSGSPKRPDYAPLRLAIQEAYWRGELGLSNPEAHKLMLLAHLQDNPKSFVAATNVFADYMEELGQLSDAKRFLRELFADRISNLASRYAAERLGVIERTPDPITGEIVDIGLTEEWKLWDRLGFTPDFDRVKAWLDNVQRGERVALDGSDARKLRQLGQFDNEEDLIRDLTGRHERDASSLAYTGTIDADGLLDRIDEAVEAHRAGDKKALWRAGKTLERAVVRILTEGATGTEFDAMRDVSRRLAAIPEGKAIIDRLRDGIGDELLARWLNLSGNLPQYRVPLDLRPRPTRPGEISRETLARVAARQPDPERAAGAALDSELLFDVVPEQTAPISEAEGLLKAISGMTDEEWFRYVRKQAYRVLKSPKATTAAKNAARRTMRDVERALYAKKVAKSRGTYVPPDERIRFQKRVLAEHGKDVEELIAPKLIAPYVEDAVGLAVEQSRTLWRTLKAASPTDVASPVRGIKFKGKTLDHLPKKVWDRLEAEVSDAIAEARGWRADNRTRARRSGRLEDSQRPVGRLTDTDPVVLKAKREALQRFAKRTGYEVSERAYDEARKVLWKGHVQNKSATWLMNRSREIVARFGGDYKDVYKRLRAKEARAEARRQLGGLAFKEMYGHSPDEILAKFVDRYSDDGQLRTFTPELTAFQRRTMEEHFKSLSGIDDLTDETLVSAWLSSRNTPPLHSREASREFLIDIGAWSPRRAEQFVEGAESWSIHAEADYWKTNYGIVPPWARVDDLAGNLNGIFHDQDLYYAQMRSWGIFNRSAEARLRLSGETAQEIEERVLKGDDVLGLKGKRELDLQRKYVIERYGDLVADGDRLIAMPWLMYPDELRAYLAKRTTEAMPDDLIRSAEELAEVEKIIEESLDEFWDKYIAPAAAQGPVRYEDIFRLSSQIQMRLLANPKWVSRYRDVFGNALNAWATFNRALVFTQLSFMIANIVDSPVKGAWYRFTRRGLFNPQLAQAPAEVRRRAEALTPADLGLDAQTTLYQLKQRPARDYLLRPLNKGLAGAIERASFFPRAAYRFAPAGAAKVELMAKMRLAQGMFPQVYAEALARLGNEELADAFARRFVKQEVLRMWPTAGDHPLEKLFNQLVPFASYMVKNKVLFISEAVAHPAILNQIEFVGRAIELENRRRWEEEHPGEPLPDWAARRIELPWAPGYFLDLGQFSDATRGLKPIYNAASGPMNYLDFTSQFVRIVNPGTQAGLLMLTNALGVTERIQWRPVRDSNGFITGYERVVTGWTEPWSDEQPTLSSVFWVLEAVKEAEQLGAGGWTNGEISQLIGKLAMFDAIRGVDKGSALNDYYFALREKNKDFAEKWLDETESGQFLKDWWASRGDRDVADFLSLWLKNERDPKRWFHSRSPEFQQRVRDAYDRIEAIRTAYEDKLFNLTPGTNEYRQTKQEMLFFISEVYRLTPELMVHEVYSKSPSEWSKQLQKWQTSKLMDEFFALDAQRPTRANFESSAEYNKALDAWRHQKEVFLKQYPQVEAELGEARTELERVRDQVESEWDRVLTRIGKRNELIEAAKAAGDAERADLLYLQNELDFSILERDHVAMYFTDEDFETLPPGLVGPPRLRDAALKKATVLLDFDRIRFEKAKREGREQQFLDDLFYGRGMSEVILKAKGGNAFGKFDPGTFVKELKKRPKLLAMYFKKNPGKEAEWKRNDEYIRLIGAWGRAARAGNWDLAERLWAKLPQWVKDRYYAKHPEKRQRAVESANYVGWLKRWVAYFERDDVKGGMDFFWSMPEWVRERYFKKHPEKRAKWEAQLKFGKQLSEYFAADKEGQTAYLEKHPELKRWLAQNVSDEERRRQAIMAAYREIPKDDQWLKRVFREKYPEIFSKEAQGERKLRRIYDRLARHPEMLPAFEKWVEAIWESYAEMLRAGITPRPRSLTLDRSRQSRRGHRSLSGEELRASI